MEKTFSLKLDELVAEAVEMLITKIKESKTESKFRSDKCLRVKDDDLMYNLEGGRYLVEVVTNGGGEIELIDNCGYSYAHTCLETYQFLEVADHLLK